MSKVIKERFLDPINGKTYLKQSDYFYKSCSKNFVGNNGYMPYSKTTINDLFGEYRILYRNTNEAIRHLCIMVDAYYNEELAQSIAKMEEPKFGDYIKKTSMVQYRGKTYSDTIKEEERARQQSDLLKQLTKEKHEAENERNTDIDKDIISFFGEGLTKEEYEFLVNEFKEWKERTGSQTKSAEELIKNICFNELDLRRARMSGINTKDLEQTYLNNLKAGGWSPNQLDLNATNEQCFGLLLKKIENERPLKEPDEEFKDVNGIKDYIEAFFLVPLAKSIGLRGIMSEAYERLIKKYSVKPKENRLSKENEDTIDNVISQLKNDQ